MPSRRTNWLLLIGASVATTTAFILTTFQSSAGDDSPRVTQVHIADPCGRIVVDDKGNPITVEIDENEDPDLEPIAGADPSIGVPDTPDERGVVVMVPAAPGKFTKATIDC